MTVKTINTLIKFAEFLIIEKMEYKNDAFQIFMERAIFNVSYLF